MMTATEARIATESQLTKLAKEFIINTVSHQIQQAINAGQYFATASLIGIVDPIPNPQKVGPKVVELLEKEGYRAKFNYCDDGPRCEAYIAIDWGEED